MLMHKKNIFNIGIKLVISYVIQTRHRNGTACKYANIMVYRRKLSCLSNQCFKSKTYRNVYVYMVTFNFPFGITMLYAHLFRLGRMNIAAGSGTSSEGNRTSL